MTWTGRLAAMLIFGALGLGLAGCEGTEEPAGGGEPQSMQEPMAPQGDGPTV